jgi:hypothetical protein
VRLRLRGPCPELRQLLVFKSELRRVTGMSEEDRETLVQLDILEANPKWRCEDGGDL